MLVDRLAKRTEANNHLGGCIKKAPKGAFLMHCLFCSANAADGGSAIGALTLGDRLTVLGNALNRILHFLFSLALHAVSLDSHK